MENAQHFAGNSTSIAVLYLSFIWAVQLAHHGFGLILCIANNMGLINIAEQ